MWRKQRKTEKVNITLCHDILLYTYYAYTFLLELSSDKLIVYKSTLTGLRDHDGVQHRMNHITAVFASDITRGHFFFVEPLKVWHVLLVLMIFWVNKSGQNGWIEWMSRNSHPYK